MSEDRLQQNKIYSTCESNEKRKSLDNQEPDGRVYGGFSVKLLKILTKSNGRVRAGSCCVVTVIVKRRKVRLYAMEV